MADFVEFWANLCQTVQLHASMRRYDHDANKGRAKFTTMFDPLLSGLITSFLGAAGGPLSFVRDIRSTLAFGCLSLSYIICKIVINEYKHSMEQLLQHF